MKLRLGFLALTAFCCLWTAFASSAVAQKFYLPFIFSLNESDVKNLSKYSTKGVVGLEDHGFMFCGTGPQNEKIWMHARFDFSRELSDSKAQGFLTWWRSFWRPVEFPDQNLVPTGRLVNTEVQKSIGIGLADLIVVDDALTNKRSAAAVLKDEGNSIEGSVGIVDAENVNWLLEGFSDDLSSVISHRDYLLEIERDKNAISVRRRGAKERTIVLDQKSWKWSSFVAAAIATSKDRIYVGGYVTDKGGQRVSKLLSFTIGSFAGRWQDSFDHQEFNFPQGFEFGQIALSYSGDIMITDLRSSRAWAAINPSSLQEEDARWARTLGKDFKLGKGVLLGNAAPHDGLHDDASLGDNIRESVQAEEARIKRELKAKERAREKRRRKREVELLAELDLPPVDDVSESMSESIEDGEFVRLITAVNPATEVAAAAAAAASSSSRAASFDGAASSSDGSASSSKSSVDELQIRIARYLNDRFDGDARGSFAQMWRNHSRVGGAGGSSVSDMSKNKHGMDATEEIRLAIEGVICDGFGGLTANDAPGRLINDRSTFPTDQVQKLSRWLLKQVSYRSRDQFDQPFRWRAVGEFVLVEVPVLKALDLPEGLSGILQAAGGRTGINRTSANDPKLRWQSGIRLVLDKNGLRTVHPWN